MPIGLHASRLLVLSSTSLVTCYSLWKLIQWRARERAQRAVNETTIQDGPLIDANDSCARQHVLAAAAQRASRWFSLVEQAKPMVEQVGGISDHKKPVLTLHPDYVLKPLRMDDHRGIREMHFYEAVFYGQKSSSSTAVTARSKRRTWMDNWDTWAMAAALVVQDPVVLQSESTLHSERKRYRKKVEQLRRLAPFLPQYYGVVTQPDTTSEAHLLLHNVIGNFSNPCVMDLKMGQETYEPDAPADKIARESAKSPSQTKLGFRIVGMRVCDDTGAVQTYAPPFTSELEAFRTFLEPASERCINNLLIQLRPIARWFDENDSIMFCASSILIAYEGTSDVVSLKMIDFGRVRHRNGGDPGYRHGLHTLHRILATLQQEAKGRIRN